MFLAKGVKTSSIAPTLDRRRDQPQKSHGEGLVIARRRHALRRVVPLDPSPQALERTLVAMLTQIEIGHPHMRAVRPLRKGKRAGFERIEE